jgi:hypothetical protein
MRFCVWILVSSSAFAQALSVSPSTGQPGKPVDVDLTYMGAGPVAPTILEWVVTYPASELSMAETGPSAGPTLQAAGKSLTCRGTWKKAPTTYSYHCILAGGQMPVPDGIVATLHLKVKPGTKAGVHPVELDDASGVTADAKKISVKKANGKLTVTTEAK